MRRQIRRHQGLRMHSMIVDDMTLIPIEHLYTKRDSIRKAREAFLIHLGNTQEPAGLNRRDEM